MSNILKQLTLENISDKATAFTVGGTPVVTYVFIAFSGALLGYIMTRPDDASATEAAAKKEEPTPKPEAVVEEAAVADGDEGEKVGGRRTRKKRKSKRKSKSKKHRYKLMNRES